MSNPYPREFWIKRDPFSDGSGDFDFSSPDYGKRYIQVDPPVRNFHKPAVNTDSRREFETRMATAFPMHSLAWDEKYNAYVYENVEQMYQGFVVLWETLFPKSPDPFDAMRQLFVKYVNLAQHGFAQEYGDELAIIHQYEALTGRDFVKDRTELRQRLKELQA